MIWEDMSAQYIADLIGVPVERAEAVAALVNADLRRLCGVKSRPPRAALASVPMDGEALPAPVPCPKPQLRLVKGGRRR